MTKAKRLSLLALALILMLSAVFSLAACGDAESYKAFARGIAHYAKENGFNGTWGPVLDVLRGDGPCRVHRHFSDDPKVVAKLHERVAAVPDTVKKHEGHPQHAVIAASAAWLKDVYDANGITSAEQLVVFARKD